MKVKKNTIELKKGKIFDRKGFILTEINEVEFDQTEVDFAQILIESKRWCKPGVNGTLKAFDEKRFWLSADAVLASPVNLEKTLEELIRAREYAKVDKNKEDEEAYSKQIKNIKSLIKQTKNLYKEAEKINKEEYEERKKNKVKNYVG